MPNPLEDLKTARAEITRLQGVESTLREQLSQVPNNDLGALLTDFAGRGEEITRLTGELSTATTRATAAETETASLRTQLANAGGDVDQRIEERAATIVASTGITPAAADTQASPGGAVKAASQRSYQEHWDHYSTLSAADKNAYYQANATAMNARR